MKIEIDLAADAAAVQWACRAPGRTQVFNPQGGRGDRLYFSDAGDVVGLEVLGWSQRTDAPTDVQVVIHPPHEGEILAEDHPLVSSLKNGFSVETDHQNRPLHDGQPMIPLAGAATLAGLDRSWLSREMTAGRLQARKIGREWWTTAAWVAEYQESRVTRAPRRAHPPAG